LDEGLFVFNPLSHLNACAIWGTKVKGTRLVAKPKRNVLDDFTERLRDFLSDLGRLINPQPAKPARVPVPVPVRPERRPQQEQVYR